MVLKSVDTHTANHNLELTVEPAQIEDTRAISLLLAKSFYSFPEFASWIYPFLQFTINEDIRHRLRSRSPHYCCLVAKLAPKNGQFFAHQVTANDSNSTVVGTIEIALRSPSLWSTGVQYPYISNLAVAENYRRLGIGKRLLAMCEKFTLDWGYSEMRLHVLDNNDVAKQLYCNSGYQISQIEANWSSMWFDYSPRLLLKKPIRLN